MVDTKFNFIHTYMGMGLFRRVHQRSHVMVILKFFQIPPSPSANREGVRLGTPSRSDNISIYREGEREERERKRARQKIHSAL